jgi:hypothetical protein
MASGALAANIKDASEIAVVIKNDELARKDFTIDTEFNGVKRSADGFYAMEVVVGNDEVMIPVGRLDIDVDDEEGFAIAMQREDISEAAKEEITQNRENMLALGMLDDYEVTVFSQLLLTSDEAQTIVYSTRSKRTGISSNGVTPFSVTNVTWNGIPMVLEDVVQTGLNTTYKTVSTGIETSNVARDITNIGLIAVGLVNTPLSIFATAMSLLTYYLDYLSLTTVTPNYNDTLQVRLIYNKTTRSAFWNDGGIWKLGVITRKVTVTNIATEQFYYNGGNGVTVPSNRNVSQVKAGANYDSPYSEAYLRASNPSLFSTLDEQIKWGVGNLTFLF